MLLKLLIAIASVLPVMTPALAAEVITVRADFWAPYNAEPGAEPGYMVEVLKQIFEKKGYQIDYQILPWARALAETKSGVFHAAIGANSEDGAGLVVPKESFCDSRSDFFVKKGGTWKYEGVESLKKVSLGVISGYGYDKSIDGYIADNQKSDRVQAANGDDALEKNVRKVLAGRLDALIEEVAVVAATLKKLGLPADSLTSVGTPGKPSPLYVVFSPAKPESKKLAGIFDEGIRELRASGKLRELMNKYGIK